jgi:CRISPR/Cas system-associated protein Csm6
MLIKEVRQKLNNSVQKLVLMDGTPYNAEKNSRFSSFTTKDVKNKTERDLLMYYFFIYQETPYVKSVKAT